MVTQITTQRTHDVIITSFLRQNDIATSLWCSNDVITASRVRWVTHCFSNSLFRLTAKGKAKVPITAPLLGKSIGDRWMPLSNGIPAPNRLTVVFNVWYSSADANPFWRVGHGRVVRTLDTTVGGGRCFWDSDARVLNWVPTREAIRSWLEFTLLPVHGDMFLCLLHTKWYQLLNTIWNTCRIIRPRAQCIYMILDMGILARRNTSRFVTDT